MIRWLLILFILGVTSLGCTRGQAPAADASASVPAAPATGPTSRAAYVPNVGTRRVDVEAILGAPAQEGMTKDGRVQAMYELQRARFRSIVYSADGRVEAVIPPQPLSPVILRYED